MNITIGSTEFVLKVHYDGVYWCISTDKILRPDGGTNRLEVMDNSFSTALDKLVERYRTELFWRTSLRTTGTF